MTTKKKTIQINFLEIFRDIFKDKAYKPLTQPDLFACLKISKAHQKDATQALTTLIVNGEIFVEKSKFCVKEKKQKIMKGILRMNPRGFGFVVAEDAKQFPEDAFIPKHCMGTAVDGDLVEVQLLPEGEKGPEGKIIAVLERGHSHLGGIVRFITKGGEATIYSPLLGLNKTMKAMHNSSSEPLVLGDRVIVKVVDWADENRIILCEIVKILGSINDASIDILAAAEEFQIAKEFSKEVLTQAKAFGKTVAKKDLNNRLDLTKIESFTIDPETARDFDDALSLSKDENNVYHLGVHIADVAHYVTQGSPLDVEARKRSNSTYFPGACFPMLPEELSNNLCSLKPKVIRLTVSVLMKFNAEGDLIGHDIVRSYIKSAKRFTYEEAMLVISKKKKSQHKPTLDLMVELCKLLKRKRSERGSIDFSLPEVVLNIDSQGEVESYRLVEYDITHQLVEEYMLKANEMVAQTLRARGLDLIFRTHEEPADENKEEFFALARSLGFFLSDKPTTKEIQKLFETIKTTPFAQQLSVAFIRSMKLATYSPDNIGHFGLALEEYCHFTSPIRRYPDLIIQRLLFNEHPPEISLNEIADACSAKERVSFKAEQSVKTLKKLRLLKKWYDEDPDRIYDCQITKIKPFSLFFELPPISIEGSLHVSEINGDYFIHEPIRNCFLGRHTNIRFCIGDTLKMKIVSLDLTILEVKWIRVFEEKGSSPPPTKSNSKNKRKKRRR